MERFICTTPCWHNGHRFRMGQVTEGKEENMPKNKEGKSVHFERLDNVIPVNPEPSGPGIEVKVDGKSQRR